MSPAKTASQKRMMCMAMGVKKGTLKTEDIKPEFRKGIMATAKNMSMEDLQKYCSEPVGK